MHFHLPLHSIMNKINRSFYFEKKIKIFRKNSIEKDPNDFGL